MGYKTEFNWVLKLKPEQGFPEKLEIGKVYEFEKNDCRVYPVDIPIDLADKDWNVVAKVVVLQFTCGFGKTKGLFKIKKIYNEDERKFLSEYWQTGLEELRGRGVVS